MNTQRMAQLLQLKLITPESLVWRRGIAKWTALRGVPELKPPPKKLGIGLIKGEAEPTEAGQPPPVPAGEPGTETEPDPRPAPEPNRTTAPPESEPSPAEMKREISSYKAPPAR